MTANILQEPLAFRRGIVQDEDVTSTYSPTRRRPTEAAFKARAVAVFHNGNPDAADAEIEWTFFDTGFKWADGTPGVSGTFRATADGYRTREMVASWHLGSVGVR